MFWRSRGSIDWLLAYGWWLTTTPSKYLSLGLLLDPAQVNEGSHIARASALFGRTTYFRMVDHYLLIVLDYLFDYKPFSFPVQRTATIRKRNHGLYDGAAIRNERTIQPANETHTNSKRSTSKALYVMHSDGSCVIGWMLNRKYHAARYVHDARAICLYTKLLCHSFSFTERCNILLLM